MSRRPRDADAKAISQANGGRYVRSGGRVAGAIRFDERWGVNVKSMHHRRSTNELKLLVVVDGSEASKRVLRYLASFLARRDRIAVHLAYIASRLPAELLESGGSEVPQREEQIEAELRSAQHRWMAIADTKPDPILRAARGMLRRAGVPASRIDSCVSSPLDARTVADEVLVMARDQQCSTVVVGHRAHSWFRGFGGGHLAEQLVRSAKGFAVWIID
jgi:nucleotide-binding universal stress UspA family protein